MKLAQQKEGAELDVVCRMPGVFVVNRFQHQITIFGRLTRTNQASVIRPPTRRCYNTNDSFADTCVFDPKFNDRRRNFKIYVTLYIFNTEMNLLTKWH